MLITFTSKAAPDVVMFGEVATTLLRVMGEEQEPPGILRGEDIKVAAGRLQAWLQQQEVPADSGTDVDSNDSEDEGEEKPNRKSRVGMRQRAFPLLEMLDAAYQRKVDVIWR